MHFIRALADGRTARSAPGDRFDGGNGGNGGRGIIAGVDPRDAGADVRRLAPGALRRNLSRLRA